MNKKSAIKLKLIDILVIIFSIFVMLTLTVETFFTVSDELKNLFSFFDVIGCFIFGFDIIKRFRSADNKIKFLLKNSVDIIASIPFVLLPVSSTFTLFGYAKTFRLIRLFKVIKVFRSVNILVHYLKSNKRNSLSLIFITCLFIFIIAGSTAILLIEGQEADGNIKTAEQALWWSYITITTVGYGDFYPVTTLGRLVACVLSMGGIGLYGAFTGIIATYFIGEQQNNSDNG